MPERLDDIEPGLVILASKAGPIMGMHPNKARRLCREGKFPIPVIAHGERYFVTKAALAAYLGVDAATLDRRVEETLSEREHAAISRLEGLGPNVVPAAEDLQTVLAVVDRLAGAR